MRSISMALRSARRFQWTLAVSLADKAVFRSQQGRPPDADNRLELASVAHTVGVLSASSQQCKNLQDIRHDRCV